ncbi:hypothetical protein SEVIR_4G178804v4 [Setaria viridis]
MERVTVPQLHEFDGKESTVIVVRMHTHVNDRVFESSKLLHFKFCCQLEQEIKASNNSVTQDLVVICVVIWTEIKYINTLVYEVDAVDAIVLLLHNRQEPLR